MCFYQELESKELSKEQWKLFIQQISKWLGSCFISFSGGEPLLRKDTTDILMYASKKGLITNIDSNGFFIDQIMAKKLTDSGLNSIVISIQSLDSKVNNEITQKENSLKKALSAIQHLKAARSKYGSDMKIYLRSILMSNNLDQIIDLVQFVRKENLDGIIVRPLFNKWKDRYKDIWIQPKQYDDLKNLINKLIGLKQKDAHINNAEKNLRLILDYYIEDNLLQPKRADNLCRSALNVLSVDPDGTLNSCLMPQMGNVTQTNIKNLFKKSKAELKHKAAFCSKCCIIGGLYEKPFKDKLKECWVMLWR